MTDHVSEAVKRIAKAEQEAADVRMVVSAVGDALASRAEHLYSRIWRGTIGGLDYKGTADDVQSLLDQLPPVPLEYILPSMWAGSIKPRSLPLGRDEQDLRQQSDCAPWWVGAWSGKHFPATCDVNWYTAVPNSDKLIRVGLEMTDVSRWVRFWVEVKRDGHGQAIGYTYHWSHKFNHPNVSTSGGSDYPQVKLWWPEGTEWAEAIAP